MSEATSMSKDLSAKPRAGLSMAESEELPQYRRPSAAAIAGFLVGLASPLALIHPMLWVVPVVAAIVSLVGVRATRRAAPGGKADLDPPLTGRLFAVLGLALAVLFAGWAPARYFSRREALIRQSREFAEHYFETVQAQQLKELHQISRRPQDRRPPGVSLEDAYNVKPRDRSADESEESQLLNLEMDPQVLLNNYLSSYPLKELLDAAKKKQLVLAWKDRSPEAPAADSAKPFSRISFDRFVRMGKYEGGLDEITLLFNWETSEGGAVRQRPLSLLVRRHELEGGEVVVWQQGLLQAPP
jgi:hypothetical protein